MGKFKIWSESYEDWIKQYELFEPKIMADPLIQQDLASFGEVRHSTMEKVLKNHANDLGAGLSRITFNKRNQNTAQQTAYQKQQEEAAMRDRRDEFYYHVLPAKRLRIVVKKGLIPGSDPVFSNYTNYTQGKTFLSEKEGISYWKWRIADHLEYNEQNTRVAVIRIPKNVVSVQVDQIGTQDSKTPSYFTNQTIPPENIEVVSK